VSWQPIETAPKGDAVLLFMPEGNGCRIGVGRLLTDGDGDYWRAGHAKGHPSQEWVWLGPTHWMPIPEPPK
jgi:hypothetical protein